MLLLLFGFGTAFSQTKTIYFYNDQLIADPSVATAYGIYGKLSGKALWVLKKYDLDDNLIVSGSYKDEQLAEPHGKFTHYGSISRYNYQNSTNYTTQVTDRYITIEGEYRDGLQVGRWYSYFPDGSVMKYFNAVNGKLHGEIRGFDYKGQTVFLGQYENGLKVGTWYDVLKRSKTVYENDKEISNKRLTRAEVLGFRLPRK